jgi:hypothetical protein
MLHSVTCCLGFFSLSLRERAGVRGLAQRRTSTLTLTLSQWERERKNLPLSALPPGEGE